MRLQKLVDRFEIDELLIDGYFDRDDFFVLLDRVADMGVQKAVRFLKDDIGPAQIKIVTEELGLTEQRLASAVQSMTQEDLKMIAQTLGTAPKTLLEFVEDLGLLSPIKQLRDLPLDNTITFEDLTYPFDYSADVPTTYEGLTWDNFRFMETDEQPPSLENSGYIANSGNNLVFNTSSKRATISSDENFAVESFYASAAWRDGVRLTVQAYDDGEFLGRQTIYVDSDATRKVELDPSLFGSVDEVGFVSSGGVDNPNSSGFGAHIAFDDFVIV